MEYDDVVLQRLWQAELEILDVVHLICKEYGLKYSLAFGTLLGAVRHEGFIPWDDDIDLIMPREDYETLIRIWRAVAPEGFVLQCKDLETDFEQNFVKIRKDGTTFLQSNSERIKKYHKGIFVDIAPCDRVASNPVSRIVQYIACAVQLLLSREYCSGNNGVVGFVEKIVLMLPKKMRPCLRELAEVIIKHWNSNESLCLMCTDTIQNCKRYFPADMFSNMKLVLFQNKEYYSIEEPDDFLKVRYGDYMQLPPIEERVWKHHPVLIDFEHNYEDIVTEHE